MYNHIQLNSRFSAALSPRWWSEGIYIEIVGADIAKNKLFLTQ